MPDGASSGRFGPAVAVLVAGALIAAAILITMNPGISTSTSTATETVIQVSTSTIVQMSTTTLTPIPTTIISTDTFTQQSLSAASANTTTSTAVSCTISGEGGPVFLQLYNNSSPLHGVAISVVHLGPVVDGRPCGTTFLPTLYTNSSGWVEIPGDGLPYAGSFQISFNYSASQYSSSVQIEPLTTTYLYISLPSGSVSTANCEFGVCPTMSDTMGMGGMSG